MSKITAKIFQLLTLVIFLFSSQAARAADSDRYVISGASVLPVSGIWWNESLSGSGYNLAVDGKGFIFLTWFTYRADGTPTFYTMSGQFVTPCGNATAVSKSCLAQKLEWSRTGIIGRLTSPIYETANGACPACVYRPNTVAVSALGNGEVVFFGNRVAELRFLNQVIKINPQPLIETIDQQLIGTWIGKSALGRQAGMPQIRDIPPLVISSASELDGLLVPAPDLMLQNQVYMPLILSNRSRVFNFGLTLIAIEPSGRIYAVGKRAYEGYVGEVFFEGNRMVVWYKDSYKPVFGSTVAIDYELQLFKENNAFSAGVTVDVVP